MKIALRIQIPWQFKKAVFDKCFNVPYEPVGRHALATVTIPSKVSRPEKRTDESTIELWNAID
jgi:hypothetical protein